MASRTLTHLQQLRPIAFILCVRWLRKLIAGDVVFHRKDSSYCCILLEKRFIRPKFPFR